MNIEQLLKGIAVVIDDELDEPNANINKITMQLIEKNYSILKCKGINEIDVEKLGFISFLLLDWELGTSILDESDIISGVRIPKLRDEIVGENIKFIRKFISITFCPIFIFSNQDVDHIKTILISEKIIIDNKPSRIFIKSKRDLENPGQLFEEIGTWLENTPSIYVLKKWEIEHQKAINTFFNDFQNYSPFWPLVLWNCFEKDGVNSSLELSELLARNLHNRMQPFLFSKEIFEKKVSESEKKDEIKKVLEGERFLPKERLHPDDIGTGDLFKISDTDYLLNIRPQCDLLRDEEVTLYCVKGEIISDKKKDNIFSKKLGQFNESINQAIVPFIDSGKIINFSFKEIIFRKFSEEKDKRIGRLLPPYITRIQQRFALYLQRQGLPRIPVETIEDIEQEKT
jgi:hypothetical protein